jgi:hypothetical protein
MKSLWFGVLGGPAAWSLQLVVGYGLEEIACSSATAGDDLGGLGVEPMIATLTAVLAGVALAAAAVSFRHYQAVSRGRIEDPRGRVGFLALGGAIASALFLVIIVLGGVQLTVLDSCGT